MNSLKNTVANAQIAYSLDFTAIIDLHNEIGVRLDTNNDVEYPQDTQPILDAIFSAQTKSEAEAKLQEFDTIIDLAYEELKDNIKKIETRLDEIEDVNQNIDACIDFLTQAESVIPDNVDSYSMTRISNAISDILSDLEDEKEYTDEDIDITELENELSQFMYPIESLIALLKKEIAEMPENIESPVIVAQTISVGKHDSDNGDDEIEAMTADEHRLTWEGANAQDIVNLVNKILTNKELATHLALEAIRAERNFATPDIDSCPNGTFSK
jgi:hypothetical protein